MDCLSWDDFKNTKISPQWSAFDYLLEVVRVDQEKAAKKRYGFSSLKHLQCNEGEHGRKKRRAIVLVPPCAPPLFPQSFRQHIEEMGGKNLVFVIEKKLFFSDVNPQASRLSIPFSQVQSHPFLTESEAELLEGNKAIRARLLEPSMVETEVNFNKWVMNKSSMYVITTAWNSVVKNNGLKDKTVVRLWSFHVNSTLCLALQKL